MDRSLAAVLDEQLTSFGGIGIITAAALILALRLFLSKEHRRTLRAPLVFLVLHLALIGVRAAVPPDAQSHDALSIAALFFLLASIARSTFLFVVRVLMYRRVVRPIPKIFADVAQAIVYAGVVLVTLRAAGVEPGSLLTTSALLTAVVGLSMQDTLGNLFAGLAIQAQRPFEIGDWVQVGDDRDLVGQVVEINWRATRLVTLEQLELTVPNGVLAKAPLRNFTKPTSVVRRQTNIVAPLTIAPRRVQRLLEDAIRTVPGVRAEPPPSVVTRDFTERGVEYEVRYFIDDFFQRELIAGEVRDRLWYALHRAEIEIPPPRRELHMYEVSAESIARDAEARLDARRKALRHVDFLDALPEDAVNKLAELTELRLFAPGETVIHEGQEGQELFIIEFGEVQVLVGRGQNSVLEVARLGPGRFFGEMSVMTGERRRATVRAVKESELIVVGKDAFDRVLKAAPELAAKISEVLAAREEELGERAAAAANDARKRVEERSTVLLDRIKEFFSL